MDLKARAKEEVLKELMDFLDQVDTDRLKSKSPKFAAMQIEMEPKEGESSDDESPLEQLKDKMMGEKESPEEDKQEGEDHRQSLYSDQLRSALRADMIFSHFLQRRSFLTE